MWDGEVHAAEHGGESGEDSGSTAWASLELRIVCEGGEIREPVRQGLTIGRAAACELIIDDPAVNLMHARVAWGMEGWELVCVGWNRVELRDEPLGQSCVVDRVTLCAGTRFWIGGVGVECLACDLAAPAMNSEIQPSPEGRRSEEATVLLNGPRLVMCPVCYRDVAGLPVVARFCPKCGGALPERDGRGVLVPPREGSPLFGVYEALRQDLRTKLVEAGELEPGVEGPAVQSLIVLAYASALLNLGWRYEQGRGLMRNLEEAGRCYAKAGRLGEAWGRAPQNMTSKT